MSLCLAWQLALAEETCKRLHRQPVHLREEAAVAAAAVMAKHASLDKHHDADTAAESVRSRSARSAFSAAGGDPAFQPTKAPASGAGSVRSEKSTRSMWSMQSMQSGASERQLAADVLRVEDVDEEGVRRLLPAAAKCSLSRVHTVQMNNSMHRILRVHSGRN